MGEGINGEVLLDLFLIECDYEYVGKKKTLIRV